MSRDKYSSFAELAASEEASAYRIVTVARDSKVAVIAPHGGNIEPRTSELAFAVAGQELSLYLFEGRKEKGNSALHITSTNFDASHAFDLLGSAMTSISFHGERSEAEAVVWLGGRDHVLGETVKQHLQAVGFDVKEHQNPNLQGTSRQNICNRT